MNSTQEEDPYYDPCEYQPQIFLEWKMAFVGVVGLLTALVSIVNNSILFYTFSASRLLRQRNLTYLQWISGCDTFISLSYIFIMCTQVYTDYFSSLTLFILWHRCLRVAFTISHVTLSSASFLLMVVTIERYLQSTGDNRSLRLFRLLATHRTMAVVFCFLVGLVLKGTVFFEVEVINYPECSGFSSMGLVSVRLFPDPVMDAIWKFWIRKIFTVFLPFAVLAYFNIRIVLNVRRTDRDQTVKALVLSVTVGNRGGTTRLRSRVRAVTRMLVMVVTCYLVANVVDVVVAFWETIDMESLSANAGFYAVFTDISSFLPILACALRLPIYATNDKQIRREVWRTVRQFLHRATSVCPFLPSSIRMKRKLYDPIEDEVKLFPPRMASQRFLEVKTNGIGTLIMARASLATQREYMELARFAERDKFETGNPSSPSNSSLSCAEFK